jgi:hypothetical protein
VPAIIALTASRIVRTEVVISFPQDELCWPVCGTRLPLGSSVLAEIIKTYTLRIVLIAGEQQKQEMIGKSHVVVVGRLV